MTTKDIGDRPARSPGEANASARPGALPLAAVIEELESAVVGNRWIDARICRAIDSSVCEISTETPGIIWRRGQRIPNDYFESEAPHFSTSLDAALTLVPEGWFFALWHNHDGIVSTVWDRPPPPDLAKYEDAPGAKSGPVRAPTLALALCIAALKARLSSLQGESDAEGERSSLSDGEANSVPRNEDQS